MASNRIKIKRRERPIVPQGVPARRCPGLYCQWQFRPLTEEFFSFHRTGKLAGKPVGYCRECMALYRQLRRVRQKRQKKTLLPQKAEERSQFVLTRELKGLLQKFINENSIDPFEVKVLRVLTSEQYIAHKVSQLSEQGSRKIRPESARRKLYSILHEECRFTRLKTADIFLTAIDKTDALSTGELAVVKWNRRRPAPVPPGVPTKKCPGPFCFGFPRPLSEFNLYKSGEQAGQPRTYCKRCDSLLARRHRWHWKLRHRESYKRYDQERNIRSRKHQEWKEYGLVDFSRPLQVIVRELYSRLGPKEMARRLGIKPASIWRWRTSPPAQIRREYAVRLVREAKKVAATDERLTGTEKQFGKGKVKVLEKGTLGRITSWRVVDSTSLEEVRH